MTSLNHQWKFQCIEKFYWKIRTYPPKHRRHSINCEIYDDIISKNSGDIGKTMLVEIEIEMGNHPPIALKPYTVPLKHYKWVQKEIETLERAGIIERSISPWTSPVVIIPKKSAPGEPPRRRM